MNDIIKSTLFSNICFLFYYFNIIHMCLIIKCLSYYQVFDLYWQFNLYIKTFKNRHYSFSIISMIEQQIIRGRE